MMVKIGGSNVGCGCNMRRGWNSNLVTNGGKCTKKQRGSGQSVCSTWKNLKGGSCGCMLKGGKRKTRKNRKDKSRK